MVLALRKAYNTRNPSNSVTNAIPSTCQFHPPTTSYRVVIKPWVETVTLSKIRMNPDLKLLQEFMHASNIETQSVDAHNQAFVTLTSSSRTHSHTCFSYTLTHMCLTHSHTHSRTCVTHRLTHTCFSHTPTHMSHARTHSRTCVLTHSLSRTHSHTCVFCHAYLLTHWLQSKFELRNESSGSL